MLGKSLKLAGLLLLLTVAAAARTIPSGTSITVRVGSEITSATAQAGQTFRGTLS